MENSTTTRILTRPNTSVAPGFLPRDWRGGAHEVGDVTALHVRAARILLDARAQARSIIASACATGEELVAAERRQAWEHGYDEGRSRARQEGAAMVGRLTTLVGNAVVAHTEGLRALDEETFELGLAIARALVRHEIHVAPDTVRDVARAALDELTLEAAVLLRVHPDDEPVMREHASSLGLPPTVSALVVADPLVSRGGLIVESGAGRVDATLETRTARMESLLRESLDAL